MNWLIFPSFLVIILGTVITDPAVAQDENVLEYAYRHAEDILERYPPDKYFVINWGPNTDLVDLFMTELIEDKATVDQYVTYIPLTKSIDTSPLEQQQVLSKVIPSFDEIGGRKIVFNRVLFSGFTAGKTSEALKSVLTSKGHKGATLNFLWRWDHAQDAHNERTASHFANSSLGFEFEIDFPQLDEKWDPYLGYAFHTRLSSGETRNQGRLKTTRFVDFDGAFEVNQSQVASRVQQFLSKHAGSTGLKRRFSQAMGRYSRSNRAIQSCLNTKLNLPD